MPIPIHTHPCFEVEYLMVVAMGIYRLGVVTIAIYVLSPLEDVNSF